MSTDSLATSLNNGVLHQPPLDALVTAALSGGRIIHELFASRNFRTSKKSSDSDLVTSVDQEVEHHITDLLSRLLPDALIVGEETVEEEDRLYAHSTTRKIFLDPLDGTTNFVHGYTEVAVSIALWENGVPVASVVYNPVEDQLFTASRGLGARRNGMLIETSTTKTISTSLVGSGWPYDQNSLGKTLSSLRLLAFEAREIRTLGSAALALCYTATGIFDAFIEYQLSPWDIAAGVLIAMEAGASVSSPDGSDFDLYSGDILVANPFIHQIMTQCLAKSS